MKKITKILFVAAVTFLSFSCSSPEKQKKTADNSKEENRTDLFFKRLQSLSDADSLKHAVWKEERGIVETLNDTMLGQFYSRLGVLYYRHALLHAADTSFSKSRDAYARIGDSANMMHMWMNGAAMQEMSGHYDTAVSIYLRVVNFFKNRADSAELANAYSNLGVAYEEMEQPGKSIEYHRKALRLRLKIKDTLNTAYSYNNLGVVYVELKDNPDSAVYYYKKAADIFKTLGADYQFATVTNNIGHIFLNKKNYDSAKVYFQHPLRIYDSLGMDQGKAEVLRSFGQLYFAEGKDGPAIESLKKSLEINKKMGMKKEILEIEKILSKIYMAQGNYALAAKTMQQYNKLNDSLLNIEKQKAIADMETKYQVKEKNKTISLLRLEEELHKRRIKYQTILISLLIIIFILIVIIFYFNRKKNIANEKQLRLELQNYLLRIDELKDEIKEKGDCTKFSEEKLKEFDLSEREIEVLKYFALGYKNAEIAEKLFVSQNTIKTHIKNIYVKLDVKNRVGALKRLDMLK